MANRTLVFLGLLALATLFLGEVAGRLEGRLAPVVVAQSIEYGTLPDTKYWGSISGAFEKVRSCSLRGVEVHTVQGRLSSAVPIYLDEPTRVRDLGIHNYGPWRVGISEYQFESTVITLVHQCPYRPWLTRTTLYP